MNLNPTNLILLMAVLSLAPFVAIMITSYVKLVIVLTLLRSAMGLPQVPSNIVINGFAIILTLFIMSPVFEQSLNLVQKNGPPRVENIGHIAQVYETAKQPLQNFLKKFSDYDTRFFFLRSAKKLWPARQCQKLTQDSMSILIPSFVLSELKYSFQIGLLLYLPFIVLDLVVANILMAMGMMMVMPSTVSMPFKLLLFVSLNGWTRVTEGLLLSYR